MENKELNLDMMQLANDHYKEEKMKNESNTYGVKNIIDEILKVAREEYKPLTDKEIKWRNDIKTDIDRVRNSSINHQKMKINGELYKSRSVSKNLAIRTTTICVFTLTAILATKGIKYDMTVDKYNSVLNQKVASELNNSEAKDFLSENNKSNREKYANYKESLAELDKSDYDFIGNRKDGIKNEYFTFYEDSLFNLSEKQVDAIDQATTKEINEFKGNNK